jgi:phosphate uptake regulator
MSQYDQKKVQEVKGSYYIYLPKKWCNKYNIGEKKRIFLKQLEDDSLLIRFNSLDAEINDSFEINLDSEMDTRGTKITTVKSEYEEYLFNLYLTAYLIGYKRIVFKKRTKIPMKLKNRIDMMTKSFHGMVVISESTTEIVAEDTTSKIDIKVLVRQILNKVGLMMSSLLEMVAESETMDDLYGEIEELIKQDDQIDELRYGIERQVHQVLLYPTLGYDNNVSPIECLHYSEAVRTIERVGDYITKLAVLLKTEPIKKKEFIMEHLNSMQETYNTVLDYFERTDSLKYFHLIQEINDYAAKSKKIINDGHPDLFYLTNIRRVKNICADIAEIRINDILSRNREKRNGTSNPK